jgi:subtilisin family serine protease
MMYRQRPQLLALLSRLLTISWTTSASAVDIDSKYNSYLRPGRDLNHRVTKEDEGQDYIILFKRGVQDVTTKLLDFNSNSNSSSNTDEGSGSENFFLPLENIRGALMRWTSSSDLLQRIQSDPDVLLVELDSAIHADANDYSAVAENTTTTYYNNSGDGGDITSDWQVPYTWALDRINQKSMPLDHDSSHVFTGAGVDVFLLDSGIRATHHEFDTGRAHCSFNLFAAAASGSSTVNSSALSPNEACHDGTGHGTHVAGIVGGNTVGVAPGVRLHSVKVLDDEGNGRASGVIAAIQYLVSVQKGNPDQRMVANLSLGGSTSEAMKVAVEAAVESGIVFVVSAGNEKKSACDQSPANSNAVITVSATNRLDMPAIYSNYGTCVDIYWYGHCRETLARSFLHPFHLLLIFLFFSLCTSPGSDIVSAWNTGDSAQKTLSGTSMASPLVAGAAALYLERNPTLTPAELWQEMKADAARGQIVFFGLNFFTGSPNLLLNLQGLENEYNATR